MPGDSWNELALLASVSVMFACMLKCKSVIHTPYSPDTHIMLLQLMHNWLLFGVSCLAAQPSLEFDQQTCS